MKPFLKQLWEQTQQVWKSLSAAQRVTLTMFLAGSAVLLTLVGMWSSQPDYVPVVTGLTPEESATATSKLSDDRIPFRYEASRSSILVPSGRLEEARLALAAQGLLGGKGKARGFELFDESSFGMTDFVQKVNYLRALQGDLERKIKSLDGIEEAHVTLSVPKEELFLRDREDPKASVEVKLRRGQELGSSQVNAIRHMVSAAVPKLSPRSVAIMDSEGRLFARFQDGNDMLAVAGDQMETRMRMERYLSDKVDMMLGQVLGPGRAAVQVAVEMDFEQIERNTKKLLNPEGEGVPLESHVETKTTNGGATGGSGTPGLGSNRPGEGGAANAGRGSGESRNEKIEKKSFHYDIVTEKVKPEVGSMRRLSVAVLVKPSFEGTGEARKPVKLKPEDITNLTAAVKNAVGFSEKRGDVVEVKDAPDSGVPEAVLLPPSLAPGSPVEGILGEIRTYLPSVGSALGVLVLLYIFSQTMKRLSQPGSTYSANLPQRNSVAAHSREALALEAVNKKYLESDEPGSNTATKKLQSEIQTLVTQNSAQASEVIRSLIH